MRDQLDHEPRSLAEIAALSPLGSAEDLDPSESGRRARSGDHAGSVSSSTARRDHTSNTGSRSGRAPRRGTVDDPNRIERRDDDRDRADRLALNEPPRRAHHADSSGQDQQVENRRPVDDVLQIVAELEARIGLVVPPDLSEPVMPGGMSCAAVSGKSSSNWATNSGRSGRGPTSDISPFATFQSLRQLVET